MKTKLLFSFIFCILGFTGFSQKWLTNDPTWVCNSNASNPSYSCDNSTLTSSYLPTYVGYIIYDLGVPYSIEKFYLNAHQLSCFPSKFALYSGPTCNGPWTVVIATTWITSGDEFSFPNTSARFWKFLCTDCHINVVEIGFFAYPRISAIYSSLSSPSPLCLTLRAQPSLTPYNWSTGETTQKISACATNNYILNNTDTTGVFVSQSYNDSIYTPNGKVHSVIRKGDSVYIGGQFTALARVTGNGALFELPRSQNTTYMPRVNGTIDLVVSDGSGGWYIAGDFTRVGLDSIKYLAHIRSDKKFDTVFHPKPNGKIKSILVSGSRLFVGGNFTKMGDVTRGYLVMLDKVTGMATSWNPAPNGPVNGLAIFGDKVYSGGSFTSIGGQTRNYLGAVDTTFAMATAWNPNPNALVRKLIPYFGKLYVLGDFTNISTLPRTRLASYTVSTGVLDTWSPNPDAVVRDLAFIGNDIYVCGGFHNIGGGARNWLASVNNTNGNVTTWIPTSTIINDSVFALGVNGNNLIVGGGFLSATPVERFYVCSFDFGPLPNPNWGLLTTWSPMAIGLYGTGAKILSIATFGNNIYIGGSLFGVNCGWRQYIAAINALSGSLVSWNPYTNGIVRSICSSGNFLYLGGDFTQVYNQGTNSNIPRNRIVQLQANGNVTGWNPNADGSVLTMTAKGDYLYVGGAFTNIGSNPRPRLSAVKISDGTSSTWTPSPNDTVKSVVIGGDSLYVGGNFTSISGSTRNRVASYRISTMALNTFDPNADNKVNALAYRNNRLYIGGQFETIGVQTRKNFASFNVKTNILQTQNPVKMSNQIQTITIADSAIYAGGLMRTENNEYYDMINTFVIKPNTSGASKIWHVDPNGLVRTLFLFKDKVYVGGDFSESLNIYQPYFTVVDNFCSVNNFLPIPADTNFCVGDSIPFWATQGNGYKYQWYKDNALIAGATKRYYIPVATGWHKALITDTVNYGSLFTNARFVTVNPMAPTTITASGPLIFCAASGQSVILTAATGTGYTWQWYKNNSLIAGATLQNYTAITSGNFHCVVYNAAGCPQESQHVIVNASGLSPVMSLTGSNPFCQGTTVTLSSNFSTGYFHQWYKDNAKIQGSTGQSLIVSTAGTYKVRDSIGTCAGFSNEITLAVNPLPLAAGAIAGEDTICQGVTTATYSIVTITNSTSYIWTLPTGTTGTSATTSITVTFGGGFTGGNITVKGHNICGDGTTASLMITKGQIPAAAGVISGSDTICPGVTSAIYSVPAITGAVTYIWTLPTGMTGSSSANNITVAIGAGFTGGAITVKGHNYCGNGTQSSKTIVKGLLPAAAGSITGATLICPTVTSGVYSVAAIANAVSYIWTLPTGVTGSSSANSINVAFGAGFTGGNITVKGHNSCGDGAISSLAVYKGVIPGSAGTISGPATVFRGSTGIVYQVTPVSGATAYLWTLPSGATGASTTNSIVVNFGASATSGNITVKAQNSCGDGPVSTLYITVEVAPAQFAPITTVSSKGVPNNAPVTIPITVTDFDSITSLSLRLDYDPTLLTYTGNVNPNPVLAGLIVNDIHLSASLHKIILVWTDIYPKTLPANSKIVDLTFTHISGTTPLIWNNVSNGGADCEYADKLGDPLYDLPTNQFYIIGDVHFQAGFKVSGNFNYNNSASTVLDNVKVYLKLNAIKIDSASTNVSGYYEFPIVQNNTYTLDGSTIKPWAGINGTDALKIQRHFAGLELLTEPVKLLAADVNLSNSINGTDALKVKRRFAGLDTSFTRGNWTFAKQTIGGDTVIVAGADVTANFYGLCVGDVNGSNIPSPGKSILSMANLVSNGVVKAGLNQEFDLPVSILQELQTSAISLVFTYPADYLTLVNLSMADKALTYHVQGDQIRVAWSEIEPVTLNRDEVFLTMRFRLNKAIEDGQSLSLSLGNESELADTWGEPFICTLSAPVVLPLNPNGTDDPAASLQNCMIYPNPATEKLTVEFNLLVSDHIRISLIDPTGRQIGILLQEDLEQGAFKRTFDLNTLPPGVYTVKIGSTANLARNYYKKLVISAK